MQQFNTDKQMNLLAFWPATIVLAAFILAGVFWTDEVGSLLNKLLYGMADSFGWYLNLLTLVGCILSVVVVVFKYGDVKIGGEDAAPKFKTFNWCAMSICGGIGVGLLFWAMGEPMFYFMTPPVAAGVEAGTRGAAIFAISQAMWDYTIPQYCMYALCGVAFALMCNNRKKDLSFGSVIEGAFGYKSPVLETIVHALTIFCLCGAVANSMGVGLMQIGAGLEAVFGIPQSVFGWLIIDIIVAAIFILSCCTGIGKGLKWMSTICMYLFFFLMAYTLIFGNSEFIGKLSCESFGKLLTEWPSKTTILNTMAPEDTWAADWDIQYWASFIVYAPIIGMFLSRMSIGRTVRQFVLVQILVPSIFCMVWIGIFGGMAINLQITGELDVWHAVNTLGMQTTVFQILGSLPFGKIFCLIFLVALIFSFCTLADPMAAVVSTISIKKLSIDDEAPKKIKILMGVIMSAAAYILVASGGVNSVKGMFVIIGMIISAVMIICYVCAFKMANKCLKEENYGCLPDGATVLETAE